jgi:protein-S-isoprenylcysteine O-methyltransferase Ste14
VTVRARAAAGLVFSLAVTAALVLGTAGDLAYWQAWVFVAVYGIHTAAITIDLARRDPALLERRVKAGPLAEPTRKQKVIQAFASVAFIGELVACGLDHRFGASRLPVVVVVAGDVLVVVGLHVVHRVFRANSFTSATVEVADGQPLVTTGPYRFVRHPMYSGALVMTLGAALALGALWGLAAWLCLVVVIVVRLVDEERQLVAGLAGYADYRADVRHRLIPWVW